MKRIVLIASAILALVTSGCKKDKNQPVSTGEAKEITENSAVLYGHVNAKDLKDSKEIGIMVSKSYNPEAVGKKYPASVIDKSNVFSIKVDKLDPATEYYYVAYMTVGAASYVGETKSFTTKETANGGKVEDKSPIKLGRWDAYHEGEDTKIDYCLIFSEGNTVDQYCFLGGSHFKGTYTLENDRLVISAQQWWQATWSPTPNPWPEIYEWVDPDTLQPYNNGFWYEVTRESDLEYFYEQFGWWFDREFILDSPTLAHGEGGQFGEEYPPLTYKYRQ